MNKNYLEKLNYYRSLDAKAIVGFLKDERTFSNDEITNMGNKLMKDDTLGIMVKKQLELSGTKIDLTLGDDAAKRMILDIVLDKPCFQFADLTFLLID